jgi:hypothetical protein
MLEQTTMLDEIRKGFSVFQNYIGMGGKLNKNDANVDAEDFVASVLNTLNSWELVNTNKGVANTACIDLIDKKRRIGVQVSSQKGSEKVNDTIACLERNQSNQSIDRLIVFSLILSRISTRLIKYAPMFPLIGVPML